MLKRGKVPGLDVILNEMLNYEENRGVVSMRCSKIPCRIGSILLLFKDCDPLHGEAVCCQSAGKDS